MLNSVRSVVGKFLPESSLLPNVNAFSFLKPVVNTSSTPLTVATSSLKNHKGERIYTNVFSQLYSDEKRAAYFTPDPSLPPPEIGPFDGASQSANDVIMQDKRFLWVVTEDNQLLISKCQTTHAVCAENKNVISAGEGILHEDNTLVLENKTGHYRVDFESLDLAIPHFQSIGINFKKIEKKDTLEDSKRLLKEQAAERAKQEAKEKQMRLRSLNLERDIGF